VKSTGSLFEEGGSDGLLKLLKKEKRGAYALWKTANFRVAKESKMIDKAVSDLALIVSKLDSTSYSDVLVIYPF